MKDMKKILLTLAKWFHVDLTEIKYVEVEKIVEVPVVEYKERIVTLEGVIDGDLTVRGNLLVEGSLTVTGECACLCTATAAARKRNAKGQFVKG